MRLVRPLVRSLSGAPINLWNRRVRLVYLDESGTSNPEQEPVLVVAGVIVNADQDWLGLDNHLKSIMRKRLPEDLRYTGIFHAKDIWHGEKKFYRNKWPLNKRMEIISDLAAIPAKFHLPVIYGAMDRKASAALLSKKGKSAADASINTLIHSLAFMGAAASLDTWMANNAKNEVAMMVAEDAGKVKQAVRMFQIGYRQDGVDDYYHELAIRGFPKNVFKTRQIVDTVHFASKLESPLLQIADTCAFLIKRRLQNASDEDVKPYFNALASQLVSSPAKTGDPEYFQVTVPRSDVEVIDPSRPETRRRQSREPRR
jgi:Protein of unknown function (DUF3800)